VCRVGVPKLADTSWNEADRTENVGWKGADLDLRDTYEKWGVTQGPLYNGETVSQGDVLQLDVTDIVQYYVTYRESMDLDNAGFAIFCHDSVVRNIYLTCGTGVSANQSPSLFIKYRETGEGYNTASLPWDGHALAFTLQTDDGRDTNIDYAAAAEASGGRLTVYINDAIGSDNYLTAAQVAALHDAGHDIAHHARQGGMGLNLGDAPDWVLGDTTDADSIAYWLDRQWLATAMGIALGDSVSEIVGLAYPSGGYNSATEAALFANQFTYGRAATGATSTNPSPTWGGGSPPTWLSWDNPSNLYAIGNKYNISQIVGAKEVDSTQQEVEDALQEMFGVAWSQGRAHAGLFAHDLKTSSYPSSTCDLDEWTWICEYVASRPDILWPTMQELVDIYLAGPHSTSDNRTWTHD